MTSQPSSFNHRTVATLLKREIENTFNTWEAEKLLRTGFPHASNILAPEGDWCLRRYVLAAVFPELAQRPEPKPWDGKRNRVNKHGWVIHEKLQGMLLKFGGGLKVVHCNGEPELDLTHFDETREVFFSPDVIVEFAGRKYVIEIKGYRAEMKSDKEDSTSTIFERLDEMGVPPKVAHTQVNFYIHLLQDVYGPDLRGLVLVENKNTQELKTWAIEHDPELAKPYTDRCYAVKGGVLIARKSGKLPPRKCVSCSESRAQACPMRTICFQKG